MVATITPKGLLDLCSRGEAIDLVDVRTPAEYGEVHVDFARNIPLDRLDPKTLAVDHAGRTGPRQDCIRAVAGRDGQRVEGPAVSELQAQPPEARRQ